MRSRSILNSSTQWGSYGAIWMRPQIKYIAGYQVARVSAITHLAPVSTIEPWEGTGNFLVNFAEPAHKLDPVSIVKSGKVKPLQGPRYAIRQQIENAKTLDDVWTPKAVKSAG